MRVVVCDDDPIARSAIGSVVEQLQGTVLGETDQSSGALSMIEWYSPDVVVLDLALRHGSGIEVLDALDQMTTPPRVIVFTAFDGATGLERRCTVVHKPDFAELERQLANGEESRAAVDRRAAVRAVAPPNGCSVDDAYDFYRMLADAVTGDALVAVTSPDPMTTGAAVRRCVRAEDRVLVRGDLVLGLLVGGGCGAVETLRSRLRDKVGNGAAEVRGVVVDQDPTAAFTALTAG